jgi:hypothetical protein
MSSPRNPSKNSSAGAALLEESVAASGTINVASDVTQDCPVTAREIEMLIGGFSDIIAAILQD